MGVAGGVQPLGQTPLLGTLAGGAAQNPLVGALAGGASNDTAAGLTAQSEIHQL